MVYRNTLKSFLQIFSLLIFIVQSAVAQDVSNQPGVSRDSLHALSKLIHHGKNDSIRISANQIFHEEIRRLLLQPGSLNLDSLKNVSFLKSPDRSFNLLTWQLPSYKGTYTFFGYIQLLNSKVNDPVVIELVDSTMKIVKPESSKLSADKWYGAVYYGIIPTKKNGKNYYTLLGWKGNNSHSTQKVIDVLYFSGEKQLFGFPFFKTERVYKSRVIFEYNAQAVMSVRYEESKKMIVFDHLTAGKKNIQLSAISGPDGTYDAFRFKNGHWELLQDVDVNAGFTPKPGVIKPKKDHEIK